MLPQYPPARQPEYGCLLPCGSRTNATPSPLQPCLPRPPTQPPSLPTICRVWYGNKNSLRAAVQLPVPNFDCRPPTDCLFFFLSVCLSAAVGILRPRSDVDPGTGRSQPGGGEDGHRSARFLFEDRDCTNSSKQLKRTCLDCESTGTGAPGPSWQIHMVGRASGHADAHNMFPLRSIASGAVWSSFFLVSCLSWC
ncbi:hypothetical protein GGR56DRAFT_398469 [Xylariaceae sp. FL0804]|nr:hypothetical protein GGR56DRAFT_398469 [Xylariaceae sp. FL0804]